MDALTNDYYLSYLTIFLISLKAHCSYIFVELLILLMLKVNFNRCYDRQYNKYLLQHCHSNYVKFTMKYLVILTFSTNYCHLFPTLSITQ